MKPDNINPLGTSFKPPPKLPASRSRRILVVEDDRSIRDFNVDALTGFGYAVDEAEDGAAAWDTLQANRYDLMVTDNHMPKVSGVELMGKLHEARIVLLVILATAATPDFTLYPWPRPAATLMKPYTVAELVTTVMEVLGVNAEELAALPITPANTAKHG